jgi:transposase-like protein
METKIRRKYSRLIVAQNKCLRQWMANEAMSIGSGGVSIVSRATGVSQSTIRKGIRELRDNEHGQQPKLEQVTLDVIVKLTIKGNPISYIEEQPNINIVFQ